MSPLWRNRLYVGLSPHQVSLLGFGRGLRPQLEIHEQILVTPTANKAPWQAALDALSSYLASSDGEAWDLHLVLSNHFAHFALIPSNKRIASAAERQTLAAIVFEERYGAISRDWEIRVSPGRRGQAILACGLPRLLLDGLKVTCCKNGRIAALRPILMNSFNRIRHHVDQGTACLAVTEQGRITLVRIRDGRWQSVTSRAVTMGDDTALDKLLAEDAALCNQVPGGTLWLDELGGPDTLKPGTAWVKQVVSYPLPAAISHDNMAIRGMA